MKVTGLRLSSRMRLMWYWSSQHYASRRPPVPTLKSTFFTSSTNRTNCYASRLSPVSTASVISLTAEQTGVTSGVWVSVPAQSPTGFCHKAVSAMK